MHDPLARGSSRPPAILGEGCVSRYDPQALSADNGAEFADAAELWRQLQADAESAAVVPLPEPKPPR